VRILIEVLFSFSFIRSHSFSHLFIHLSEVLFKKSGTFSSGVVKLWSCIDLQSSSLSQHFILTYLACLYDQNKGGFLKGRLLSSQSEQFNSIQIALIGWKKAGPPKKSLFFDHVNRLIMY